MLKKVLAFLTLSFPFSCLGASSYLLHGNKIEDPYAYLEEMDSEKTQSWLDTQQLETEAYYSTLSNRDYLRKKLVEYTPTEQQFCPLQKNGKLFSFYRAEGADKYRLEMQLEDGTSQTLIDPTHFDAKDNISLRGLKLSQDGNELYYALSQSGSDFNTWKLYDVQSQCEKPSEITHTKFFSPLWSNDSKGVYYSKFEKGDFSSPDRNLGIFYHSNSDAKDEKDLLIVSNHLAEKRLFPVCLVDDTHLLYFREEGCSQKPGIFLCHLETKEVKQLVDDDFAKYVFIQKSKDHLYFLTDDQASNHKLIAVPLNPLNFEQALEILPETQHCLEDVLITKDYILGNYTIDCQSCVKVFDHEGQYLKSLELEEASNVSFGGSSAEFDTYQNNEMYFSASTFTQPSTVYRYKLKENVSEVFFKSKIPQKDWVTQQVFFTSKDGTQVPMFICHKKGLVLNGQTPTLMWGYGGFGCSMTPYYSPHHAVWLEQGGIFVSVNLRGGLEYGKAWHDAGRLHHKQNVFDDFIAAGEYLIEKGYTSSNHLAIHGTSNGGLLVGACLIQRPELFKAAVAQVPVMDMLKFHKFTIGSAWISDYGNPDHPGDFEVLYQYSPYHNAHKVTHPPSVLVLTADHDDRVVPLHSYKFVARLKENSKNEAPILLKVNRQQGHGSGGGSVQKMIDLQADILSFLNRELNMEQN